jgi:hypothetical protein
VAIIVDGKLLTTHIISKTTEGGFIELTNIGSPKTIHEIIDVLKGIHVFP